MIPQSFCLILLLSLLACTTPSKDSTEIDKKAIIEQVQKMLDDYHEAIGREGLTGEFQFLDHSSDFFWVPPGYNSALTYDSVKTILEANASLFSNVQFQWKTLQIFPLTNEIANYSGIVEGVMMDTSGHSTSVAIIESGTIIKRSEGWKLLSGQSANLVTE